MITITVTMRESANENPRSARVSHRASVRPPAVIATIASQRAARSARSCVRERDSCAWRTISITCAR